MTPVSANNTNKSGFTLVEVLIFVTLLSVMFVAFATITASSLTREQTNIHNILGQHYGEELREWISGQKEINWDEFVATKMGVWCFNTEPVVAWPATSGSCSNYTLNNQFKRDISLTSNVENTQVTVYIDVSWKDGSTINSAPLKTVVTVYE